MEGYLGEKRLTKKLPKILSEVLPIFIQEYSFEEHPAIQLRGIDGSLTIKWDIKIRDSSYAKYDDIVLELQCGYKKGWFYTSKADIIIYGFWIDKEKTEVNMDKIFILFLNKCREYFTEDKLKRYSQKISQSNDNKGVKWFTSLIPIKIVDFPKDCLFIFRNT